MENQLHCGACMEEFESIDELNCHLNDCPAAKVLLPFINHQIFINDTFGHTLSHLIQSIHNSSHLIKQYANIISSDSALSTNYRSKIHSKLCDSLGLDYNKFRPFESTEIRYIPTYDQALKIIWKALEIELEKTLEK